MQKIQSGKPVVLVFGGHDPSGCAGVQADIETIAAHGCHAATVITMLTTQSIREFRGFITPDITEFRQQACAILETMDVRAIKIGATGDPVLLETLVDMLSEEESLPLVLDPVLASTSGYNLVNRDVLDFLAGTLIPMVDILTPNSVEARLLTSENYSLDEAAAALLESGCLNVLLTGTHENTEKVINTHYCKDREPEYFEYRRLPGEYRGSGCILSSAIAANLALGTGTTEAIRMALDYTWNCLNATANTAGETVIPDRISWKLKS